MLSIISSCSLSKANRPTTKKLRHVVAFKFKPEVTTEQMQKVTTHFYSLKAQIPQIIEFEGGPDIAFQQKMGKYTHCFIVTVNNEKDLATYGSHPFHQAFSKSVDPLLAEVMVVDYWTE
jgi:hypothetical protein